MTITHQLIEDKNTGVMEPWTMVKANGSTYHFKGTLTREQVIEEVAKMEELFDAAY